MLPVTYGTVHYSLSGMPGKSAPKISGASVDAEKSFLKNSTDNPPDSGHHQKVPVILLSQN